MPIQDYFRMKNVFGDSNPASPGYKNPNKTPNFFTDEESKSPIKAVQSVEEEDQPDEVSALDQFREQVLNPPQHKNPGIMRALGTGLLSGLQGTESGQRKPVYNAAGKVIGSQPKGFWETFGSKPFDVKEAGDILDMPNEQRLADWKLKTGGLKEAATLETGLVKNKGLAEQRLANAAVIPKREDRLGAQGDTRLDQSQQRINILKDKEAKHTLTDKEAIELNAAKKSEQIDQQGNIKSGQIDQQGDIRSRQIGEQGDNTLAAVDARNAGNLEAIGARGTESRETKQVVPGKNTSPVADKDLLPSQQKTNLQIRANQYVQEHPEHKDLVKINPNTGMVDIEMPKDWRGNTSEADKKIYNDIVAHMKGGDEKGKSPAQSKTDTKAPPVIKKDNKGKNAGSVVEPTNLGKIITQRSPSTGKVRTSTDGGKTWTIK